MIIKLEIGDSLAVRFPSGRMVVIMSTPEGDGEGISSTPQPAEESDAMLTWIKRDGKWIESNTAVLMSKGKR